MANERLKRYVTYALIFAVAAFILLLRSWMAVAFVVCVGYCFQLGNIYRTTKMEFLGGFPSATWSGHKKVPVPLTQKRGFLLYYSPLPPDIDVLWDTRIVDLSDGSSYKVRFVRSGSMWLAQRTARGGFVGMPVSTREPINSQNWQTWYIADGDWPDTVLPPRNMQEKAQWRPTGPANKYKGYPLVVLSPGDAKNMPSRREERRRR